MKELKPGRPSKSKKVLDLDDVKSDRVRVSIDLDAEMHRRMKYRALDEGRGLIEMLREIIEREFK